MTKMKSCPTCGREFKRIDYYEKHIQGHRAETKANRPYFYIGITLQENIGSEEEPMDIVAILGKRDGYRHIANVREVAINLSEKQVALNHGSLVIIKSTSEWDAEDAVVVEAI